MQKKYFFFDIDGTLTNDNPGGIILPSTLTTIRKLEENGHFVAIATGRSQSMAMEFANQIGIKNLVHDGGNGLTLNGKIVYIHPLDHDWALDIIHECLAKDIPFFVAIDNSYQRYARDHGMEKTDAHLSELFTIHVDPELDFDTLPEIHKIFIGLAEGEEDRLVSIHLNGGYMRYEPTQIVIEPGDKVKGIRDMMAYLQAPFEDVVVFGDGKNDISMIQAAPLSIAMGNAIDEVKQAASFVTKSCQEDGIAYACQHFGWIDGWEE